MSLVHDLGNDNEAIAKTLWAHSEDDEEWYAYLELSESHNEHEFQQSSNMFETLVNQTLTDVYSDQNAVEDVDRLFQDAAEQFT